MTTPRLTPQQLAEIRERHEADNVGGAFPYNNYEGRPKPFKEFAEEMNADRAALLSHIASQPAGMPTTPHKFVPRDPTPEMVQAYDVAIHAYPRPKGVTKNLFHPDKQCIRWQAMYDAAPDAPALAQALPSVLTEEERRFVEGAVKKHTEIGIEYQALDIAPTDAEIVNGRLLKIIDRLTRPSSSPQADTSVERRNMLNEPETENPNWPDPTKAMLATPEFNAIWNVVRTWDVNVPHAYIGYCAATGNHARAIYDALFTTVGPSSAEELAREWLAAEIITWTDARIASLAALIERSRASSPQGTDVGWNRTDNGMRRRAGEAPEGSAREGRG